MKGMGLTGKWSGYYEYGYGYGLDYFGKRISIEIELTDKDGSISGKCIEQESSISTNQKSDIKGFYEDEIISFVKTYPKINNTDKNYQIEYLGEIDESRVKIYGKWIISDIGFKDSLEYEELGGEGIWFLEKNA